MINRSWVAFSSMEKTIFNALDEKTSACTRACVPQDRGSGTKDLLDLNQNLKHVIANVSLGYYI